MVTDKSSKFNMLVRKKKHSESCLFLWQQKLYQIALDEIHSIVIIYFRYYFKYRNLHRGCDANAYCGAFVQNSGREYINYKCQDVGICPYG